MKSYHIYVVLTRTNTNMSRAIQLFKRDEYTHASITLDPELSHMYSFGRKYTYNPLIGHFKREELHSGLFGIQKNLPSVVYEIEVSASQYHRVKMLIEAFVSEKEKYKYNYMGLIHSVQRKSHEYENRFLCSEFVYHVLRESDILDLKTPRNLIRPEHLRQVGWPICYEGDLKVLHPIESQIEPEPSLIGVINKKLSLIYQPFI